MRCPSLMQFAALILLVAGPFTSAHGQWEIEESHTTASLRGIHNVGGGVAWASGSNGTVLRTEDGGYLWQTCAVPSGAEKLDFRGIQAFDENTAIVMSSGPGNESRLYKTTDGCQTWQLVLKNTDPKGFWDVLQTQHGDYGFGDSEGYSLLIGDPIAGSFDIQVSPNLFDKHPGDQWVVEEPTHYRALDKEALFAASNSSAIVFGSHRFILATGGTNGSRLIVSPLLAGGAVGDNAKAYPVPIAHGSDAAGIFSIAAKDAQLIVAVGGDYKTPNVGTSTAATSFDVGRHWTAAQTPPHGYRSAVAYEVKTKTWITIGPNGTDISMDDGRNWHALMPTAQDAPDADKNWNALSLPFVVGAKGRIGKLRTNALTAAPSQ